jgi:hypothetical protein
MAAAYAVLALLGGLAGAAAGAWFGGGLVAICGGIIGANVFALGAMAACLFRPFQAISSTDGVSAHDAAMLEPVLQATRLHWAHVEGSLGR